VRKSKEPGTDPIRMKPQQAGHCKDRWSSTDNGRSLAVKEQGEEEEGKDDQKLVRQTESVSQQGIFPGNASTLA